LYEKQIVIISPAEFPGTAGDTANFSEMIRHLSIELKVLLICPKNSDSNNKDLGFSSNVEIIRIPYRPSRLKQSKKEFKLKTYFQLFFFLLVEFFTVLETLARKRTRFVFVRHSILTLHLPIIFRLFSIRVIADGELISDLFRDDVNQKILWLLKKYEKNVLKCYTYYKVSTLNQAENLQKFGFPKEKILIIPVGINIKKIPKFSIEEIPEHTFGYFGVLEKWQGVDLLLKGFELLLKKIPNATLFIIGEGSMKESLIETVTKNNLSSNVIFTSVPREVLFQEYFKKFRIVVIPRPKQNDSTDTILPIKLVESFAAGKPVIVMNIPVMREIPENTICIVESSSPEALAKAMEKLSLDNKKMKEYAEAGLISSRNYDIEDKMKKLVSSLIDER
jgi:glycosyltransferase involved in cell wall biosynthesis